MATLYERITLFLLFSFYLSISAGIISYFVFGIMYLIEDFEIWKECTDSKLWTYILITLIITSNKFLISNEAQNHYNTYTFSIIAGLIEFGFAIWGGIELFYSAKHCDTLQSSHLWTFGLATFILQILYGCIFISKRNN